MPDYPTSPKSFTTKNAGDSILAAHVNDMQDEINAVEAGLLNGTARLNSSGSTLNSLQVTGGSTLSGTLQSSNSTLNALSVSSGSTFRLRPIMPPPEIAYVYRDSSWAIGSSASSTIAWNAQAYVQNSSMHSTATNPERLIPQSTGVYQMVGQIRNASTGPVIQVVQIRDSTNTEIATMRVGRPDGANEFFGVQVVGYKRFDVLGGYLTLSLGATALSTASLSSGLGETWAALYKL